VGNEDRGPPALGWWTYPPPPPPPADLRLEVTGSPTAINVGDTVKYSSRVTNRVQARCARSSSTPFAPKRGLSCHSSRAARAGRRMLRRSANSGRFRALGSRCYGSRRIATGDPLGYGLRESKIPPRLISNLRPEVSRNTACRSSSSSIGSAPHSPPGAVRFARDLSSRARRRTL
jgi:hypothetical protein